MKQQATTAVSKVFLQLFITAFVLFALIMTSMPAQAQSPSCYPYWSYYGMGTFTFNIYAGSTATGTPIYRLPISSTGAGYTDMSQTPSLAKGATYTFQWAGGAWGSGTYFNYYQYVALFLDANGNNTFDNASGVPFTSNAGVATNSGECMYYSGSYISTVTTTFTIPTNGTSGSRRFRLLTNYYGYGSAHCWPCQNYGYGTYLDFNVNAQYVTQNDAGISAVVSPSAMFSSLVPQLMQVTLKNYSKNTLTSCNVNWSVDGVTKTPIAWTGNLDSGQTIAVTLAPAYSYTVNTSTWGPMALSAWTSNLVGTNVVANSYGDAKPANDRLDASIPALLNDAGFLNADAMIPIAFGPNNVLLTIKNYAPRPLVNCMIYWQVDGVAQTPFYWADAGNPILMGATRTVNVGTYYFGGGTQAYSIRAWTGQPNGVPDEYTPNDGNTVEVYKALVGGTYTIGPRESDYVSIIEATDFVNYWGLAGPVTFLIRPYTYQGGIIFTPKARQFPITFESITRRNLDVIVQNTGTSSANDFVFKLDGYDGLTFRNLTLTANGTMGKVIHLTNGTDNILIDGCQLNGITSPGALTSNAIIYADGGVNNFKATKNTFSKGSFAAYFNDISSSITNGKTNPDVALASSGVNFSNNEIAGVTTGGFWLNGPTNQLIDGNTFFGNGYKNGIYSSGSGTILNNRINNVTDNGAGTISGTQAGGIFAAGATFSIHDNTVGGTNINGITANGASDVTIANNNVNISTGLTYERAGIAIIGAGTNADTKSNIVQTTNAHGIYYSGSANADVLYNNIISSGGTSIRGALTFGTSGGNIADNMISATNEFGLVITDPTSVNVWYNTVLSNTLTGHAAHVMNTRGGTVTMARNIFQNNAAGIALHTIGTNPVSNNNNIFSKAGTYSVLNNGVNSTLATWQTASGQDVNSSAVEAMFMSPTDLRLTTVNNSLYYTSAMFTGTTYDMFEAKDFTNTTRTKTFYKGAHSIIPTITIAEEPSDIVDCIGTTNHALVVVANADYNATLTYQWYKDGLALTGQTNPIFYINNALTHDMNAIYQCMVTANGEATGKNTRPTLLYTLRPTKITRQPENRRIDLGQLSTFDVDMNVFQEDPIDYQPSIQWYRGGVMLQDNDRIAGTKSSILTIRDIQAIDYGNDYYVKITGKCGTDSSVMIDMSEIPKLTLTDLAATLDLCVGSPLSLTVAAVTSVPNVKIGYQWMLNGVAIAGATSATYTVATVAAVNAGDYTCVVTLENNYDTKTTTVCKVTVDTAPEIVTNLAASVSVQTGRDLSLAVVAKGNNLTYQWLKNNTDIVGETNATYTRAGVVAADEGTYSVKITNPCGVVTSTECVVSITPFLLMGLDGQAGEFILNQNTPNPFSTTTTISFVLPEASNVKLAITDLYGRELALVADRAMSAGYNQLDVRALESNLNAGVYFYTLTVNGKSDTKTMVVVK